MWLDGGAIDCFVSVRLSKSSWDCRYTPFLCRLRKIRHVANSTPIFSPNRGVEKKMCIRPYLRKKGCEGFKISGPGSFHK